MHSKKLLSSLVVMGGLMLTLSNTSFGASVCPYDVVGSTVLSPEYQFLPDGKVTFGMAAWWEDDVYACYNTHLNPAYLTYFERCDRDGSGLVEIEEVMEMYNWVINHPTGGTPAYEYQCPQASCVDLEGVDFSSGTGPILPIGGAVINGECKPIWGNDIPMGIALYQTQQDCYSTCMVTSPKTKLGSYHIAVIMINYSDAEPPLTVEEVREGIFDHENSVARFFDEASYGRMTLTGDLFGWYQSYELPPNGNCYHPDGDALNFAAADADLHAYDGFVIFANYDEKPCTFAGLAIGGEVLIETLQGDVASRICRVQNQEFKLSPEDLPHVRGPLTNKVIPHEMFHTFFTEDSHAKTFDCGDEALLLDPAYTCEVDGYGNVYSMMGTSNNSQGHHPTASMKEALGWLEPWDILEVTQSGDYTLTAYETTEPGLKAIKIPLPEPIVVPEMKSNGDIRGYIFLDHVYVEYRGLTGFDYREDRTICKFGCINIDDPHGALIDLVATNRNSPIHYLVDTRPRTLEGLTMGESVYMDTSDAPLPLGHSFLEPHNNLLIETIAVNEGQDITVRVTLQ